MEKIKVGFGQLYNAKACKVIGAEEATYKFSFGEMEVVAILGPHARHIILGMKIGPSAPKDVQSSERITRAREYEIPSPDIFPADVYLELVATQMIDVEEDLAKAFFEKDLKARDRILKIGDEKKQSFKKAIDYVAGILGLRLHCLLVSIPIIEQSYAYRKKGNPYAFSTIWKGRVTDNYQLDVNEMSENIIKERFPALVSRWKWEKASEVLAWLLRAWSAEDQVLKFVSLFTPLESVIPAMPADEKVKEFKEKRDKILSLIRDHADALDKVNLTMLVKDVPSPPLSKRFENWASMAILPAWENDIVAFNKFSGMRNSLLHRGEPDVKFQVDILPNDVRTLEDITERYVSLALFGDANVYKSKRVATS
jgi:hypothetical protein